MPNETSFKVISVDMFDIPLKGISVFSDNFVTIIGKRTVEIDGILKEQYLYNIDGYTPDNGLPFVSLVSNIILI